MRTARLLAILIASLPGAAAAQLPPDANPHIVYTGNGGSKLSAGGIDFWGIGQAPLRYRVLGTITDRRGDGRFSGNAIGSKSVAKQIKALGGDGVIVMSQAPDYSGEIATTMMVVKYVD